MDFSVIWMINHSTSPGKIRLHRHFQSWDSVCLWVFEAVMNAWCVWALLAQYLKDGLHRKIPLRFHQCLQKQHNGFKHVSAVEFHEGTVWIQSCHSDVSQLGCGCTGVSSFRKSQKYSLAHSRKTVQRVTVWYDYFLLCFLKSIWNLD